MKSLASLLSILAVALTVAGCNGPTICEADGSQPLRELRLEPGMDCIRSSFTIPRYSALTCGALPSDFVGARIVLEGRVNQNWRLVVDRMDGMPDKLCAAALDERCRCEQTACTTSTADRQLVWDLGISDRTRQEVVLGAGTYTAQFCSRPME